MGVYTQIEFLNENDPEYQKAINGTPEDREAWEDCFGYIEDRPGAVIEGADGIVTETDDEYGGWIIKMSDIPKDATHIVIYRS